MAADATAYPPEYADTKSRLVRAWLLTALIDGLFSSCLAAFFYGSTVTRLWQGVASVLIGAKAFELGLHTALIGVVMHLTVAFTWSAVFLFLVMRLPLVRRVLETPFGAVKVASVYGPCIWLAMSPDERLALTHTPILRSHAWRME